MVYEIRDLTFDLLFKTLNVLDYLYILQLKENEKEIKHLAHNTRLVHWLAEVHSAGFAPAFTLSVSRRTNNHRPVVKGSFRKKEDTIC
jgi:hypothetical protein